MAFIYLDNNSTTKIDSEIARVLCDNIAAGYVNPASQHRPGQIARKKLEETRSAILKTMGASYEGMHSDSLVFTSGGTESNNLAISGLAFESDGSLPQDKRVLLSSIEHPSVKSIGDYLASLGFDVQPIRCLSDGVLDLDHLNTLLQKPTRLVSVMTVNHETGAIQPIKAIVDLCRRYGALVHTDAVQAVGKIDLSFSDLGVDALSFTAHKIHGPKGIGGLLLKHSVSLFPRLFGGFQQQGFRPGTEDVCLPMALLATIAKYTTNVEQRIFKIAQLRDSLEQQLSDNCDVIINCQNTNRVAHTSNIAFRHVSRQEFLMSADINQLAVSTGSACASGSSEPSPVLRAMRLDDDVVNSSIRISLSAFTTAAEIDSACQRIIKLANNLRR